MKSREVDRCCRRRCRPRRTRSRRRVPTLAVSGATSVTWRSGASRVGSVGRRRSLGGDDGPGRRGARRGCSWVGVLVGRRAGRRGRRGGRDRLPGGDGAGGERREVGGDPGQPGAGGGDPEVGGGAGRGRWRGSAGRPTEVSGLPPSTSAEAAGRRRWRCRPGPRPGTIRARPGRSPKNGAEVGVGLGGSCSRCPWRSRARRRCCRAQDRRGQGARATASPAEAVGDGEALAAVLPLDSLSL